MEIEIDKSFSYAQFHVHDNKICDQDRTCEEGGVVL